MDTIQKDNENASGIRLLVVGTESQMVYILPADPVGSQVLANPIELPAVPAKFVVTGIFNVEWRVFVACRDGCIYSIKNGSSRGTAVLTGSVIDPGYAVVALARQDKTLWVATMDRTVGSYTVRGKRTECLCMPEDIVEICVANFNRGSVNTVLLVALSTGEIRMYSKGRAIHSFTVEKPVLSMSTGNYGREANALVIVHGKSQALTIKLLKRTASLEALKVTSCSCSVVCLLTVVVPERTARRACARTFLFSLELR
jgi:Bardet-Biedl syndrome 1 protein